MALHHQLVGLQHESGLRWRAYFHEVDLGNIEIANTKTRSRSCQHLSPSL